MAQQNFETGPKPFAGYQLSKVPASDDTLTRVGPGTPCG